MGMGEDFLSYRVDAEHRLPHDLMVAAIAPRPIGWIATLAPDRTRNLAPYSFFNMLSYHPPLIGFASIGWKDTVANVRATGEFVWNLATRPLAEAVNATSATVAASEDEFEHARLAAVPSLVVGPPRVAQSPVAFECSLTEMVHLRDLGGVPTRSWLVVGQVVAVHVRRDLLVGESIDIVRAQPILRAGGHGEYFGIAAEHRFHMPRPG